MNDIINSVDKITASPWLIVAAVAVLLVIFFIIFKTSFKLAVKIILNAVVGFVLLFIFNALGANFGITLAVNWINAIIAGVLGIPGIALLLVLRFMGIM